MVQPVTPQEKAAVDLLLGFMADVVDAGRAAREQAQAARAAYCPR